MSKLRIGVVQMQSTDDCWENLGQVAAFLTEAEKNKCDLVCFPENVLYRGPQDKRRTESFIELSDHSQIIEGSPFSVELAALLRATPMSVSFGSILETNPDLPDRPFNTHILTSPFLKGAVTCYQKIHLFRYQSPTANFDEAQHLSPGSEIVSGTVQGWNVGLSICYDLRFPELYRKLALTHQTRLTLIPAAFTQVTGEAHWHALLRARAIENLSFVAASGQWGSHVDSAGKKQHCYGHSLIYDPWGGLVCEAPGEGDALLVADLKLDLLLDARFRLQALGDVKIL